MDLITILFFHCRHYLGNVKKAVAKISFNIKEISYDIEFIFYYFYLICHRYIFTYLILSYCLINEIMYKVHNTMY